MTTQRDQPSGISTQEELRPADEHVVTSDTETTSAPGDGDSKQAPAAASDVTTDDASPNDQKSATGKSENQSEPHRTRHAKRRWDKLQKRLGEAQRIEAENQARIAELEQQVNKLTSAKPAPDEPKLKDYKTPQEYAKAYADWEKRDAAPADTQPRTRRAPAAAAAPIQPQPKAGDDEIEKFTKRGKERLGDEFLEAIQDDPTDPTPINQAMGEFIFDSDVGPEIFVHLSNNKAEARKIYDSSPIRQEKMLKALEARAAKNELDVGDGELVIEDLPTPGEHDTGDKAPQKQVKTGTKAPAPPSSTKDAGASGTKVDPEHESMDDYAARRNKEELRRRGVIV